MSGYTVGKAAYGPSVVYRRNGRIGVGATTLVSDEGVAAIDEEFRDVLPEEDDVVLGVVYVEYDDWRIVEYSDRVTTTEGLTA